MDYLGIESIKNAYAESIIADDKSKARRIIENIYSAPVFYPAEIHGEDQIPVNTVNTCFTDISVDISALTQEISAAATKYNNLLSNVKTRLEAVDEILSAEEDRIRDINMICGNYDEFTRIISYTDSDVQGDVSVINKNIFCAASSSFDEITFSIDSVTGNGYEGNNYVLNPTDFTAFLKDSVSTSNRNNMIDGSEITYYEYSRINSSGQKDSSVPLEVNYDTENVKCTISISSSDTAFSLLNFNCAGKCAITDISYSDNGGITYTPTITKTILLNDPEVKYRNASVFSGTNIICIPATNNVKITFESSESLEDTLAYAKTEATSNDSTSSTITLLPEATRKAIKINEITASTSQFSTATMTISDIITSSAKSIAVFANEFVSGFINSSDELITYILTVNGTEYNVVPLNSNKSGTKIIRYGSNLHNEEYVTTINETIKSASLQITIKAPTSQCTPFLSNLKVCIGDNQ